MKSYIPYILICLISIVSCKREIDIDIKSKPSVLVVDAILHQDSLIGINLSWTQNIKDNGEKKVVTNAVIKLFDSDTVILDVLQNMNNGYYEAGAYKPLPGDNYLFKISVDDKDYWVNERMPDSLRCQVQDTSRIVFQGKQDFFQLTLKLQDSVSFNNYYGIRIKRNYDQYIGDDTIRKSEWVKIETIDFILTENPQTRFSNQHLVFSDRFFDGSAPLLRFGASDLFKVLGQKTTVLELYVSSYSINGYNFYTSLNEHLFYQNDPFSQPTLVNGNVSGAYGSIVGEFTKVFKIYF